MVRDVENLDELVSLVAQRLFVPMEASGRHVHVTRQQAVTLFGHDLTPQRPLSQPGQYLARERVSLVGPKGTLEQVAVLGPARKEAQVEISLTDGRVLGIKPPIRLSGDVANTPGICLKGPCGEVMLTQGVMAAQRHIHLNPEQAARFGVRDRQVVQLQALTARPLIFQDVVVRVSPDFEGAVHLDYDEANSCALSCGDFGRVIT